MSNINWPPAIPTPLIENFSYQNSDQVVLNEMANGPPIARLRSTHAYSRFNISLLLCGLQKRLFTAFYEKTLSFGSKWFNVDLNIDMEPVAHVCLLTNPTYTCLGTHWVVSATMISDSTRSPECCDVLNTATASNMLQTASLEDFKELIEGLDEPINPIFGQVQLQLSMDGPQTSTTIIDDSVYKRVPSQVLGFLFEGQKRFGQASYAGAFNERVYYDQASGLPSIIGQNPYCIECFIRIEDTVGTPIITTLGEGNVPQLEFGLALQDGQHFLTLKKVGSDLGPVTSSPIPYEVWIHVAVCRQGTITRMFQNGAQIAASSDFGDYGDPDNDFFHVGGSNAGSGERMLIDEYRLTVGPDAAIYTEPFNIPSSAFPAQ